MTKPARRTIHAAIAAANAHNAAAAAVRLAIAASYAAAAADADDIVAAAHEDGLLAAADRALTAANARIAAWQRAADDELARLVRDQREDARVAFVTRRPLPDDGERAARFDGLDDGDAEFGAVELYPFFM